MTFSSMMKKGPLLDDNSESERSFLASSGLRHVAKTVLSSDVISAWTRPKPRPRDALGWNGSCSRYAIGHARRRTQ